MKIQSRFQLIKIVGEGATAKVFKAIDSETNEKVAVKVLGEDTSSQQFLQTKNCFENEKKSLKMLNQENIVKLVSHGKAKFNQSEDSDEESQFIALEYIKGVELIEFLMCKGALKE